MTLGSGGGQFIEQALGQVPALDPQALRADFPCLDQQIRGHRLVYLDNAATTQKPQAVIDALVGYYTRDCANVHRGVHTLSQRATQSYEGAREVVRAHLNAGELKEVIFTKGATEAINLVAQTWGRQNVGPGDEILVTQMEHHSNIVPWQMLCQATGAQLRVVPVDDDGALRLDAFDQLLSERTKLVAVVHVSNALGTVNPVADLISRAHAAGAKVLIDGAQAVPHAHVDVRALDADFYVFSGHKVYGPTGIGVLYGKRALLEAMPPYQGGGDMIRQVTFEKTTYAGLPNKFEAGTPPIAEAIGLAAALKYIQGVGLQAIALHEADLVRHASDLLSEIPGLRLVGTAPHKAAVCSFVLDGVHPHDLGTILDHEGVAIRAGHHCVQPLMDRFGVPATARASFALYNTHDDVHALARAVRHAVELFA